VGESERNARTDERDGLSEGTGGPERDGQRERARRGPSASGASRNEPRGFLEIFNGFSTEPPRVRTRCGFAAGELLSSPLMRDLHDAVRVIHESKSEREHALIDRSFASRSDHSADYSQSRKRVRESPPLRRGWISTISPSSFSHCFSFLCNSRVTFERSFSRLLFLDSREREIAPRARARHVLARRRG